ncbi:MAG: NCS2 family permease [Candidatus Omnitrophica bacterium]|nr:NCS2 family permease [Candidatus Omnitrophota bacterium]
MRKTFFQLKENKTSIRTEVLAGLTTFLTMAYIIFVQPAVLSGKMFGIQTGMDFGAITTATCLSAALATVIMALYARYPIAQAPGMGENFFFVFSVIPAATAAGFANAWQVALGVVFISGVLFLILTLTKMQAYLIEAVSSSMKNGIAVGIGLFIAFIGMQNAGVIVKASGTAVKLTSHFDSPDLAIFFFGLLLISVLHVRKIPGSILIGIAASTLLAIATKSLIPHLPGALQEAETVKDSLLMTRFEIIHQIVQPPPSLKPIFMKMDLAGALSVSMIPFIIIFLFMDIFDTIGTLIGVSEQAGFVKNNKLPRADRALLADAVGTVAGAGMGTSTVTSFVESVTGIEQGGRTGLTGLTVAALFLLALFFSPVIAMVGSYAPITAPALVIVGAMMLQNVKKIQWDDYSESIPAFLMMIGIPLSYSIADGLIIGFVSYPLIKFFSGKGKEVKGLMYVIALILAAYFFFLRSKM